MPTQTFSEWFNSQLVKPYVRGLGEQNISISEQDLLRVTNERGLWHLSDYAITSLSGGSLWLTRRDK